MNTELIILLVCSFAIAVLGLIIFTRSRTGLINRRFAFLAASLVLWAMANYGSDHFLKFDLFFTRLTFFAGVLSIRGMALFIYDFPNKSSQNHKKYLIAHTLMTYAVLPIIFTPYFVISVGTASIITGIAYPAFLTYVAYSLLFLAIISRQQAKSSKTNDQKQQARIVFISVFFYAFFTVLSNIAIPFFVDNWSSSRIGPIFTLIFVSAVAYSMVKYKLFNVKLVIVRSLGYILSLVTVGAITFLLLTRSSALFDAHNLSASSRVDIFALITIGMALLFEPFKRLFSKLSNRLFYRDAYDIQDLLNEFNKVVVSTIELDKLLKLSIQTLDRFIRPLSITIAVSRARAGDIKIVSERTSNVSAEEISIINSFLMKDRRQMLVTDFLDDGKDMEFKNHLRGLNIGMLARFDAKLSDSGSGFIMLGSKKSGEAYDSQDVNSLDIIRKELTVVIQNALRFEEIERFNVTLEDKVQIATQKLRRANDKLKALDESKDDFISMASHQLRTPLTSIKGYISMVLEGDAGKVTPMQHEMLGQAFFSSQRMVYLISDLLNVSRLKTGKFVIERSKVNLATMVAQELDQLKETAAARQLTLTHNNPDNFPDLMLDETKTRQVIMNFVDNAIYYTPAGGHINVKLIDNPNNIELRVEDDGIGVSVSDQHHLFTKFYRAGNARKARPDGTGLGLFMAKKVIIAEEGNLIFESKEGKGSTFGFVFYKSKAGVTK